MFSRCADFDMVQKLIGPRLLILWLFYDFWFQMAYVILCWLSKHRKWRMNLSRFGRLSHLCDIWLNIFVILFSTVAWKLWLFQLSPLAWPKKAIALFQGTMGKSMTRGMSWAWCYGLTRNQARHHTFVFFPYLAWLAPIIPSSWALCVTL